MDGKYINQFQDAEELLTNLYQITTEWVKLIGKITTHRGTKTMIMDQNQM